MFNLAERIAKGRNYYINHDKSKENDEWAHNKLFDYSYLLEDILLTNIYLELILIKML